MIKCAVLLLLLASAGYAEEMPNIGSCPDLSDNESDGSKGDLDLTPILGPGIPGISANLILLLLRQIKNDLTELKIDMTEVKADVSELKEDQNSLQTTVGGLVIKVSNLETLTNGMLDFYDCSVAWLWCTEQGLSSTFSCIQFNKGAHRTFSRRIIGKIMSSASRFIL